MNNAFNDYKNQAQMKILMAKKEELPLFLYDGAIKFCNIAIVGIEKKDFEKAHINIVKVENIIEYLRVTLDETKEVSKDFINIYNYIDYHLVQANVKKDVEELNLVLKELRDLKELWQKILNNN